MVLEHKSSDVGNSDMPKSICKVLLFSEKVQGFDVYGKKKNYMLRLLRSLVRKNLLFIKL